MVWDFKGQEEPVTQRLDRKEFKEEMQVLKRSFNKKSLEKEEVQRKLERGGSEQGCGHGQGSKSHPTSLCSRRDCLAEVIGHRISVTRNRNE